MDKIFSSRRFGFTLVELLIVITIIGILMTLATMAFLPAQKKVRDSKRKADLSAFQTGLKLFESDFKVYPNPTMYLGTVTTAATGDENNNLGLETDIAACQGNGPGGAVNFTLPVISSPFTKDTLNQPVTAGSYTGYYTMKPGFASVNNLLVCLKLLDKIYSDPNSSWTGQTGGYQYRVSYDYSEYIVISRLENLSDREKTDQMFVLPNAAQNNSGVYSSGTDYTHYIDGNGINTRQLDDDTNARCVEGTGGSCVAVNGVYGLVNDYSSSPRGRLGFYDTLVDIASTPSAVNAFGISSYYPLYTQAYRDRWYFYQCAKKADNSSITLDDRSSPDYAPLKLEATSGKWATNPSCKQIYSHSDGVNDKAIIQSY